MLKAPPLLQNDFSLNKNTASQYFFAIKEKLQRPSGVKIDMCNASGRIISKMSWKSSGALVDQNRSMPKSPIVH